MSNVVIGLGNAGTQIVKLACKSKLLEDCRMFAIDSVAASVDMSTITNLTIIPIISDEKSGSGRNRERGRAMFDYQYELGTFDEMMEVASEATAPIIVITSAAGGTGSGSTPSLIQKLKEKGLDVIPVIICPNMSDPDTYHMNTADLMVELSEQGVETYSIFRNSVTGVDYNPINKDVVKLIEVVFGKLYLKTTTRDTIDDSDLDSILSVPGRFIALSVEAHDITTLKKELIRKVLGGYQPAWTSEETQTTTFCRAYSLTSPFASNDFDEVFEELNSRISGRFEEFKNVADDDNNGMCTASVIIAGLPRAEMKEVSGTFNTADGIASGMKKATRPAFMTQKKASVTNTNKSNGSGTKGFSWKK